MKKYKLIKEYPGSLSLGTIVSSENKTDLWKGTNYYDKYPEYWEEVVEKDYEIISYWSPRIGDSKYLYYEGHEDWDNINKSQCHSIHSVKRLSDGEVFTVGDRIKVYQHGSIKTIDRISEEKNILFKNGIWLVYDSGGCTIDHAIKQPQPIYLTHDGKDIFPKDIVWYVNKENFYHDYIKAYPEVKFNSEIRAYFLTQEEAKEYIIENKPALSIKEFWEITWMSTSGFNKHTYMKNLVKERLNLK